MTINPNPTALDMDAVEQVNDRFAMAKSYADSALSTATGLLGTLNGAGAFTAAGTAPSVNVGAPGVPDSPVPSKPAAFSPDVDAVAFPSLTEMRGDLAFEEIVITPPTLPALPPESPSITLPTAPTDALPEMPTDVPTIGDTELPATPSLDLPPVPVLEEVTLPAVPAIQTLTFDAVLPTADLTPPEPMFVWNEPTYASDIKDAVRTRLYNDITLGGTGLSAEIEAAIWARAIARLDIELEKEYRQVLSNFQNWNYEFPDGVLASALQEVITESNRRRQDTNRDISIKQAELAQQNTHFAITNGLVFEKQVMDFINLGNQRAFEAAKYTIEAAINIYNAKVAAFVARMEGYKVQAQVYEARIRAELAVVELYRAQMEGAKIHGELQMQKVAIYTSRVQAVATLIDLYRAQMEGAKIKTEVDRTRIEGFRALVEAKVAQIGGVTAKYNLYQAQLAGETTKVDLYGKQVQAYGTQVEAVKTVSQISIAEAEAKIEANKARVELLKAAIDRYKIEVEAETSEEDIKGRNYAANLQAYAAELQSFQQYAGNLVEVFKGQVQAAAAQAQAYVSQSEANLRAAVAATDVQGRAMETAAQVAGQMAASAMSSVNASATIGYNASESNSYSGQESLSASESFNWNTNYSGTLD
jgi:hypothetical protein